MRNGAVATLLIVVVAVGAGAGYLFGNTNGRTVTSILTTYLPPVTTTMTTIRPSLELFANLTPVVATQGQNITVVAEVYNPLPIAVTSQVMPLSNPAYGRCGAFPTGILVYAGHYSFSNISQATPLLIYGPGPYQCPALATYQIIFNPNSDVATIQPSINGQKQRNFTTPISETSVVNGYWSVRGNLTFHEFGSGFYTVRISDVWGQQTLGYFEVK